MAKRNKFKSAIDKVSESNKFTPSNTEEVSAQEVVKPDDSQVAAPKIIAPVKKYTLEDAKKLIPEEKRKKRKAFTMMLRPDLKNYLNIIAQNKNISLSQVMEDILIEYFDIKN